MRKRTGPTVTVLAAGAVAMLAIGSYAVAGSGTKHVRAATMSGYLEAPPASTVAHGSFEGEINDAGTALHYRLSYSGLEDVVRQAHIHFGQRGVSAGIIAWLCQTTLNPAPAGTAPPTCPQSGTVTGTLSSTDVIGPTGQGIAPGEFGELLAALRAGRGYANVHTTKFQGGEIRGQINDSDHEDD